MKLRIHHSKEQGKQRLSDTSPGGVNHGPKNTEAGWSKLKSCGKSEAYSHRYGQRDASWAISNCHKPLHQMHVAQQITTVSRLIIVDIVGGGHSSQSTYLCNHSDEQSLFNIDKLLSTTLLSGSSAKPLHAKLHLRNLAVVQLRKCECRTWAHRQANSVKGVMERRVLR